MSVQTTVSKKDRTDGGSRLSPDVTQENVAVDWSTTSRNTLNVSPLPPEKTRVLFELDICSPYVRVALPLRRVLAKPAVPFPACQDNP